MAPVVMLAAPALGQAPHPIPEAERWATITHAGNQAYHYADGFGRPHEVGAVDHEYQISRTEVTAGEWIEFVRAYAPYAGLSALSINLTSRWVLWNPVLQDYTIAAGADNRPVEIAWRYAAIYANWLHNDKAPAAEAFTSGAYDTATFITNPDGTFQDQITRSPGARYWIPSLDELIKAYHYDPNRHGPGEPGYWIYPHGSDNPPIRGAPGVGETNTGYRLDVDVASYRDVQSPWGLWDAAGGVSEWTEGVASSEGAQYPILRLFDGSAYFHPDTTADRIDAYGSGGLGYRVGLRLARAVPSPSSAIVLIGAVHLFTARRRRPAHDTQSQARRIRCGSNRPRTFVADVGDAQRGAGQPFDPPDV